jgi:RNA polymerase sigma-70 factor (ECF subfamily)
LGGAVFFPLSKKRRTAAKKCRYRAPVASVYRSDERNPGPTTSEAVVDDDLLRRCQRGDATALSELIRRHQDRLFRVAVRVLRDPARAEDAVADAFAAVWFRCGSWRGEAAATWLHRVAYRVMLDHARARRRWWRLFTPAWASNEAAAEPGHDLDQQAYQSKRLEQAVATLTPEDRILIHLHYFEGQSLAAIAVVLRVSRDALKMRLSRARAHLREALGEDDELF